jgi:pimeloyl-ACP methyl ester carboxylesterase
MNPADAVRRAGLILALAVLLALALGIAPAGAGEAVAGLTLQPCRLKGVEHDARCGVLKRPLDPSVPAGMAIDLHVAVLPAVARNKKPDPVFFFAGGPGQSAIDLAPSVQGLLGRFLNRRDIVLIDQRGTGRSAPLKCEAEPADQSLAQANDPVRQATRLRACRDRLATLPHGDLRRYTTSIAMADAEAVRVALGAGPINVVGGSYGTRAVLEYLRLYPASVRRAVIDGVAPPDMVLPLSFSTDAQAAFDALLGACERDARCSGLYPRLRSDWQALLASLPREVRVAHPLTGHQEVLTLTRDQLTGLVRLPLYAPVLASALPYAVTEARAGRFTALVGLTTALGGGRGLELAMGMHFSVVCAEDLPRLGLATDRPGPDFGDAMARLYRDACAGWPVGAVASAFYTVPPTPAPTLVLSGGADPVTPPRHGDRVTRALGANARHLVVPESGHGTLALGCMRDVVFRFVDAPDGLAALAGLTAGATCGRAVPRPPAFAPVTPRASDLNPSPAPSRSSLGLPAAPAGALR